MVGIKVKPHHEYSPVNLSSRGGFGTEASVILGYGWDQVINYLPFLDWQNRGLDKMKTPPLRLMNTIRTYMQRPGIRSHTIEITISSTSPTCGINSLLITIVPENSKKLEVMLKPPCYFRGRLA
jgi:hypothetical protein